MKNSHVSIVINDNIRVMVLLHRVWKKHPVNVDFLGVYIDNDNQYSPLVHGLIGTTLWCERLSDLTGFVVWCNVSYDLPV